MKNANEVRSYCEGNEEEQTGFSIVKADFAKESSGRAHISSQFLV